jgi:hypothetical protein
VGCRKRVRACDFVWQFWAVGRWAGRWRASSWSERHALCERVGREVELARIVDLFPGQSAERHGLPRDLYAGRATSSHPSRRAAEIEGILADESIDLVVETIGGSGEAILRIARGVLEHGQAPGDGEQGAPCQARGRAARRRAKAGPRPRLRGCRVRRDPDHQGAERVPHRRRTPVSISGIMNGTSNYILSQMASEGQTFDAALEGRAGEGLRGGRSHARHRRR